MDFDRSDREPDEYDPEAEFRDPDSDSLTIPRVPTEDAGSGLRDDLRSDLELESVDVPSVSTDPSDVSSELRKTFWAIVLVVNGAVLSFSLGVILLAFRGVSTYSIALLVGGVVLFGSAVRRYKTYERENASDPKADDSSAQASETRSEQANGENANELTSSETTSRDLSQGGAPDESDRS